MSGESTQGPEPFFDGDIDPFAPPPLPPDQASAASGPPQPWGHGGPWPPPGCPPPGYPPPGAGGYSPPGAGGYPPPGPPHPPPRWSYGGPWPAPYSQPRSTNGFAIAALCCGIGGLVTEGIAGVLGVIFGIVALRQIGRSHQSGRGLAIAGIVVGAVTILLGILLLVALLTTTGGGGGGNGLVS